VNSCVRQSATIYLAKRLAIDSLYKIYARKLAQWPLLQELQQIEIENLVLEKGTRVVLNCPKLAYISLKCNVVFGSENNRILPELVLKDVDLKELKGYIAADKPIVLCIGDGYYYDDYDDGVLRIEIPTVNEPLRPDSSDGEEDDFHECDYDYDDYYGSGQNLIDEAVEEFALPNKRQEDSLSDQDENAYLEYQMQFDKKQKV
jgi:hypothetical protein